MRSKWNAALFSSILLILSARPIEGAAMVDRVIWEGNEIVSSRDLSASSLLPGAASLSDSLLQLEMARIDSIYFSYGFLAVEAAVDTFSSGGRLVVAIDIDEGERASIAGIGFTGSASPDSVRIETSLGVSEGDPFQPLVLGASMDRLLRSLNEEGYPFAQIWLTGFSYDEKTNSVELSFSIYEGEISTISSLLFEGIAKTDSSVARRISRLRIGSVFNEARLERATGYLANSGLFESVGTPQVIRKSADMVDLVIPLIEMKNNNSFQGAFGFSRKDDGDYRVNGAIQLVLNNIAGRGRDMRFDWLSDGQKYTRTELTFTEPFLLSMPVHLDAELRQAVDDTLYDLVSAGFYARLPLGPEYSLVAGVASERTVFGDGGELEKSGRQRYRLGLTRECRDCLNLKLHVEGARRTSRYSGGRVEREGQFLYHLEGSARIPVTSRHSIYARLVSEAVLSSGAVPLSEMFQLGGARSLRGYRENQFRGERIDYINLEYRFGGESRIFLFNDTGAWYRESEGWTVKNGFGFGLRSSSKIGTIELSFGVGDKVSLNDTKIHISLIETF